MGWWRNLSPSLRIRVVVLLAIALLPLGLIAILQTRATVLENERLAEASIINETERAARQKREVMLLGFGAAAAIGEMALQKLGNLNACSDLLASFVDDTESYVFAGFIEADGIMRCSSTRAVFDFSDRDGFKRIKATPRPWIQLRAAGAITGLPVLIVTKPVYEYGTLVGFISLSIKWDDRRQTILGRDVEEEGYKLILFDHEGQLIASDIEQQQLASVLPAKESLVDLTSRVRETFVTASEGGGDRQYALVPILDENVFALSSWDAPVRSGASQLDGLFRLAFPILMCVVSLSVAYAAVNRLVIVPLKGLQGGVVAFRDGVRREGDLVELGEAPRELQELAAAFNSLTRTVSADEVEREEALQEKTVLLREVYHRVKNNLQLIVSILNMQIRNAVTPRERFLLQQLQERVMALSVVHKNLYTAASLASVRADTLLEEIVRSLANIGTQGLGRFRIETDFDPVTLYPDQAVPLALLVTEAGTNALKHAGVDHKGARINFVLRKIGDARVRVEVENTRLGTPDPTESTGLGSNLIDAFVHQLDGTLEREETDALYRLSLEFPLASGDVATDPDGTE
ncbi:MAG: sensor histidine kinase [Pseudomonadota bacterium]